VITNKPLFRAFAGASYCFITVAGFTAKNRVIPAFASRDFESEEWKERVAILEYEDNMSREEAEFSAIVSLDAQINLSKPENVSSEYDYKRAA
jgi:hypothetical protein